MNLKSETTGNVLKIFLWASIALASIIFVTTLIYTINYDFYLQIASIDVFLGFIFGIVFIMLGFIYLIWLFKIHKDLKSMNPAYPITPWGAIARVLIPFYNLVGLWSVYSTMDRHFKKYDDTKSSGSRLMIYVPIYYVLHLGVNGLDRLLTRSYAQEMFGESYDVFLTISYALNIVLCVTYLLIVRLVTKAVGILATMTDNNEDVTEATDAIKEDNNVEVHGDYVGNKILTTSSLLENINGGLNIKKPKPLKAIQVLSWISIGFLSITVIFNVIILLVNASPNSGYNEFRYEYLSAFVVDPTTHSIPYTLGFLIPTFLIFILSYSLILFFINKKLFKTLLITLILLTIFSISSTDVFRVLFALSILIIFLSSYTSIKAYMKEPQPVKENSNELIQV